LRGKKVNFNTVGTAAAYSGPLIFDKLKLDVQKTFIPHQVALQEMKAGTDDMEAVVFITSKPIDAFQKGNWPDGFKFLPVPFQDFSFYLPATLSSNDYPQLIPQAKRYRRSLCRPSWRPIIGPRDPTATSGSRDWSSACSASSTPYKGPVSIPNGRTSLSMRRFPAFCAFLRRRSGWTGQPLLRKLVGRLTSQRLT
jgi:hypothetical protein